MHVCVRDRGAHTQVRAHVRIKCACTHIQRHHAPEPAGTGLGLAGAAGAAARQRRKRCVMWGQATGGRSFCCCWAWNRQGC